MKILIADDHALIRQGFKKIILENFPGAICLEAEEAQGALQTAARTELDLVTLDISMPGSGLEALKEIKKLKPKLPVLVVSMHSEEQYGLRVIKAGAAGYVTKAKASHELVEAVRRALKGEHYIGPTMAEKMALALEQDAQALPHELLSDREFQVFLLLASGKTVTTVSSELHLSVQTVSTHRTHILQKMGLHSNAELVRYALENKLLE